MTSSGPMRKLPRGAGREAVCRQSEGRNCGKKSCIDLDRPTEAGSHGERAERGCLPSVGRTQLQLFFILFLFFRRGAPACSGRPALQRSCLYSPAAENHAKRIDKFPHLRKMKVQRIPSVGSGVHARKPHILTPPVHGTGSSARMLAGHFSCDKTCIFSSSRLACFPVDKHLLLCYHMIAPVGKKPKAEGNVVRPSGVAKTLKFCPLRATGCEAPHLAVRFSGGHFSCDPPAANALP